MDTLEKRPYGEKGQSLVELALSILFLFILVAGVVDLGRAFVTYIALRDAAQEGAAYASVARTDKTEAMQCANITTRTQTSSDTQIVDLAQTSVDIIFDVTLVPPGVPCAGASNANACFGHEVEVRVSFANFQLTTPLLGTVLGSQTFPISASIIDTVLTPPCH